MQKLIQAPLEPTQHPLVQGLCGYDTQLTKDFQFPGLWASAHIPDEKPWMGADHITMNRPHIDLDKSERA